MYHQETGVLEDSLYAKLYQCYATGLFAYAYQQTLSREEAEDIVLDVFLSVLENPHFPGFDEKKQEAWLWTITRNKVVDAYRRSTHRQHVSIDWLAETLAEAEHLAPEYLSLKREEYGQLSSALRALPEPQQEIMRLRFGHNLKCKAIAAVLGISEGAVRTTLLRTLQRLRTIYHDQGKEGKR